MADYEIEIDLDTGRGTIKEIDHSYVPTPVFDKITNILFYVAGLVALVAMLITMISAQIPFWIIAAFLTLAYIIAPIIISMPYLEDVLPYKMARKLKKLKIKPYQVVLNMLLWAYFVLICLEVYLLKTIGMSFGTLSILVACMYGIYFLPFLFYRQAKLSKSLFTCIYAWISCIASAVLFIVFGEIYQVMDDFGPILLPFFISVFYMIHSLIKLILKKSKKYGNNRYYETVAPVIKCGILIILFLGIIGFAVWGATLSM